MAVVTGVESAIQIHIDRGDDLNARDDKGQTPLMLAAARNKANICKLLLDAGANASLLAPSGMDALGIAHAAGAVEAASVIEAASFSLELPAGGDVSDDLGSVPMDEDPTATGHPSAEINPIDANPSPSPEQNHVNTGIAFASEPMPIIKWGVKSSDDDSPFDLTGWEAEEEQPPPDGDPALSAAASEIQNAISDHQPIDTSADWEDFEAYLPERASPLPRADDAEGRERLRLVLLRAVREGSVPESSIEDLSLGDDGSPDQEACALLRMVINDLGAETDERFEYSSAYESFEVPVAPHETPSEEETVDEVLAFIDDLAMRRNEPLRLFQKEFQREALLTGEAEVALGQAMERGVEKALDALASWPEGIASVLHAARLVKSKDKPIRWLSSGPPAEPQDLEEPPDIVSAHEAEALGEENEGDSHLDLDETESIDELSELSAKAERLSELVNGENEDGAEWRARRDAISSLRLTRGFLLELTDSCPEGAQEPALAFATAMNSYRLARDRMAVANLKLVFSIAKKYLYSSQPLDDLFQEGNIGLIKAIDRYDWRRGFKFSTYATWWIRQQVGRYVADKCKTIRLPVHAYETTQRISHAAHAMEMETGRAPTTDEIAKRLGLPEHKVAALSLAVLEPLPIHEVDLDRDIAIDVRDDFAAKDPMDIVSDRQLINAIDRFLGSIKVKEENILRMRFGIGVNEPMTLDEIGTRMNVTRERIRQIESSAIRHLQHPSRLDQLLRELNGNLPPQRDADKLDDADANGKSTEKTSKAVEKQSRAVKSRKHASPKHEQAQSEVHSAIDDLIEKVMEAGVSVDDDRDGRSGRIWVHLAEQVDEESSEWARKLIGLGFAFWPGKGFWR